MRTAMLLMPLTLIMLAGCGKKPPEPKADPPFVPPAPPAPTLVDHWDGLEIHLTGLKVVGGKTRADFSILNNNARAADWRALALCAVTVRDGWGNRHLPERGANADALIAAGDITHRLPASSGHARDSYWFSTPPRGCGSLWFTARMPDGKTLRWAAPESMIERR